MKTPNLVLLIGLSLTCFGALAQEVIKTPGDPKSGIDWYKRYSNKGPALATDSYFHEGYGCSQDWWRIGLGSDYISVSPNDEFVSVDFRGPAGTTVTVYDSYSFGQTDDFAIMIKTDDDPVCVVNFEEVEPGRWYNYRGYQIWYSGGNGLDGKVSSLRWGRWW